jgi:hypothetical protein
MICLGGIRLFFVFYESEATYNKLFDFIHSLLSVRTSEEKTLTQFCNFVRMTHP